MAENAAQSKELGSKLSALLSQVSKLLNIVEKRSIETIRHPMHSSSLLSNATTAGVKRCASDNHMLCLKNEPVARQSLDTKQPSAQFQLSGADSSNSSSGDDTIKTGELFKRIKS